MTSQYKTTYNFCVAGTFIACSLFSLRLALDLPERSPLRSFGVPSALSLPPATEQLVWLSFGVLLLSLGLLGFYRYFEVRAVVPKKIPGRKK